MYLTQADAIKAALEEMVECVKSHPVSLAPGARRGSHDNDPRYLASPGPPRRSRFDANDPERGRRPLPQMQRRSRFDADSTERARRAFAEGIGTGEVAHDGSQPWGDAGDWYDWHNLPGFRLPGARFGGR